MQSKAIAATYKTDVDSWKSIPNEDALKLKTSLIALRNAPPSSPLMSVLMLSATPDSNTFLSIEVMWLAGKRLQKERMPSENCDNGMYAPITKPDAAVKIPKNAVHVEDFLNNRTITIKSAVDEIDPRSTIP